MININEKTSCSASDIYYRILQLGSEHTEKGISLNELKKQLQTECLVSNPENTEHIEEWFDCAFQHKIYGCECPIRKTTNDCGCKDDTDECNKFDHHNECRRFLSKNSIIEFSQLEQSHKLNEQLRLNKQQVDLLQNQLLTLNSQILLTEQNSNKAKTESKIAFKLAIWALILTSVFGLPDWIVMCKEWSNQTIEQSTNPIKALQKEQLLHTQQTNQYLDSLNLNQMLLLQMETQGNISLETINGTLKTLNKNLKHDKK